jgi:hypothetical protein
MSDEQKPTEEQPTPRGEIIERLRAGIDLGRLHGAGAGHPSPAGAKVDVQTGDIDRPKPERKVEEKPKEELKPEPQGEVVAALDRISGYVERLRRRVGAE